MNASFCFDYKECSFNESCVNKTGLFALTLLNIPQPGFISSHLLVM